MTARLTPPNLSSASRTPGSYRLQPSLDVVCHPKGVDEEIAQQCERKKKKGGGSAVTLAPLDGSSAIFSSHHWPTQPFIWSSENQKGPRRGEKKEGSNGRVPIETNRPRPFRFTIEEADSGTCFKWD